MSWRDRIGLRILLLVASFLFTDAVGGKFREELNNIKTALTVAGKKDKFGDE